MTDSTQSEQVNLDGQVAIVTGAGRGIGRAMARGLAKAGACVAVVARTQDQLDETVALIKGADGRAISIAADVTDQQAIERMVSAVEEQLGPVDLLVSNAGHPGEIGAMWETDPTVWWRCLEVNLRGPFLCARAVLPGMIARGHGRIITTASHTGLSSWPGASAYATSKAAVIRLCEILADETREHSIPVFAIHPGGVKTALTAAQFFKSEAARKWMPEIYDYVNGGGEGQPPEQAADLVVQLASGRADALSGCYITIDDDLDELVLQADEFRQHELRTLRMGMALPAASETT